MGFSAPCRVPTKPLLIRRGPSSDHADTLIWDFQHPELQKLNFCCWQATQSVVLCDSSPNGWSWVQSKESDGIIITWLLSPRSLSSCCPHYQVPYPSKRAPAVPTDVFTHQAEKKREVSAQGFHTCSKMSSLLNQPCNSLASQYCYGAPQCWLTKTRGMCFPTENSTGDLSKIMDWM